MPEEDKQTKEQKAEATPAKSGGMLKFIIFGFVAVVLVVVIAVGAMYLMKDKPSASAEAEDSHDKIAQEITKKVADKPSAKQADDGHDAEHGSAETAEGELDMADLDDSAIDKIMDNLAFLDYEPSEDEMVSEEGGMTKKDSIEQVNWLDKEKTALAQREKDLNKLQRDLARLEKEVNKKLLNLEQVESARTAQLAKLYDGMDPRAVANLLANLDDKTVVSILPRMKLKNASAALQLMPAQRAAKLSKQMITIAEK